MATFDCKDVSLKPVTKAYNRFLRDLYCTSRDYEVAGAPLPQEQITEFLRQQFALQQKHFDKYFADAERKLIMLGDKPIGRIYVQHDRKKKNLHLIDITLLREYRGKGIGRYLLAQLIARAKDKKASLSLYVHPLNPVQKFYRSLGFEQFPSKHEHLYMLKNLS